MMAARECPTQPAQMQAAGVNDWHPICVPVGQLWFTGGVFVSRSWLKESAVIKFEMQSLLGRSHLSLQPQET